VHQISHNPLPDPSFVDISFPSSPKPPVTFVLLTFVNCFFDESEGSAYSDGDYAVTDNDDSTHDDDDSTSTIAA
jgi:hypothetical protein